MAKRSIKSPNAAPLSPAGEESVTPAPPVKLYVTLTELPQGKVLHRVHQNQYRADQFNPGVQGNARFSPIQDDKGNPIPTLYGGTTMDCALMETIFHDVPHAAGFKSFDSGKLVGQVHSTLRIAQPLQLADLASVPLRKLGVTRRQLIDTEKDQYPATRKWAEAIYQQYPQVQGLSWISRQDDSARAVVLFGDRIAQNALISHDPSRSLLEDGDAYDAVLDLAERIGVSVIPGKS
ncbi:TPA: RES family NAD+ phosphorylase [Salmonella enterica subsp. houtenae serovar 47:z36:-]|nr:RES family NAD+ phosphorylase [Salmonella enterica]HCM1977419.1 RES family NAD+ phosphorylase [Salmonella enterica subsp. houtenae serovar 47:z36:-]HCM1979035.1 RES family NAD+ phosphorylase [Salmonella enterica subsp. houtenae serovar 47:z36:-]